MAERISDCLAGKLAVHLGPNVAKMAVKTFAQKALSRKPEEITAEQVPALIEAIRPMLVVMIGREPSAVVLDEIRRECGA
jgi:hypothetical protein